MKVLFHTLLVLLATVIIAEARASVGLCRTGDLRAGR